MPKIADSAILASVVSAMREALCLRGVEITAATKFADDLALDSLDMWELALSLEEKFDIEFSHAAIARFEVVADVANYLGRRCVGTGAAPDVGGFALAA